MNVSPKAVAWIAFLTTVFQGITGGTTYLVNVVPADWIPYVTAWLHLIVFINLSFLTVFCGAVGPGVGPWAKPPTVDEARKIMDQAVHNGEPK